MDFSIIEIPFTDLNNQITNKLTFYQLGHLFSEVDYYHIFAEPCDDHVIFKTFAFSTFKFIKSYLLLRQHKLGR